MKRSSHHPREDLFCHHEEGMVLFYLEAVLDAETCTADVIHGQRLVQIAHAGFFSGACYLGKLFEQDVSRCVQVREQLKFT